VSSHATSHYAWANFSHSTPQPRLYEVLNANLNTYYRYVAYSSGEVILYNTKSKVEGQTMACRKLYKLPHTGANLLSSSEASVEGSEDEEGAALKVSHLHTSFSL